MKKPKDKPATSAPEPVTVARDAVVEPPKINPRGTQAEYTSRMKYTIIGAPAPRGRS